MKTILFILIILGIYYTVTICAVYYINNKNKKVYKIKCILKDGYIDKMYCPAHWLDQYKKLYINGYGNDIKNIIIKPVKIWMIPNPYKKIFDEHWDNVDKIFSDMLNHLTKEK